MKILLVEDDAALRRNMEEKLGMEGCKTLSCGDGEEGLYYLLENSCDLAIVDRMLPGLDGLSLVKQARAKDIATPVLMLTALDAIGDRVDGFDAGADDYLTKPFDFRELLARVRALARRPPPLAGGNVLQSGDISLQVDNYLFTGPGGHYQLSQKEGELLGVFLSSPGQTIPKATLYNRVWGPDSDTYESSLDSYILFLRRRLSVAKSTLQIKNRRGVGYALVEGETDG